MEDKTQQTHTQTDSRTKETHKKTRKKRKEGKKGRKITARSTNIFCLHVFILHDNNDRNKIKHPIPTIQVTDIEVHE
jgi:hypothetical protein